jgi:hypothetical protein
VNKLKYRIHEVISTEWLTSLSTSIKLKYCLIKRISHHRHLLHSNNICHLIFLTSKHLPFTPSPLRLNIFAYLWSFRWPNYIVTLPIYFSFRLSHLNIPTAPPQTNWTKIFRERRIFYFYVIETDTPTCDLRWIFHMHSEFSRPAMCNNAIMIISSQM